MKAADNVLWVGIDYSLMRMIGTTNAIRVPDLLFQNMPARWNDLFLDERIEGVAKSLDKRVDIDIAGVTERNKQLNAGQLDLNNKTKDVIKESHLSPKLVADAVQSIRLTREKGVGLMFLVDRIVIERKLVTMPANSHKDAPVNYNWNACAVYVVFFDVATREVLSSKREVRNVGTGGSFRNFWFGPIKDVDSELSQYRE